jgi:ribose transport system ATP-binding protein
MGNQAPFLRIEHLSRSYPGVQALADVSFDVHSGQLHALVGENGAGKSTLIKILAGALEPDQGMIWLNGQPYRPHNPHDALQLGVSTIYQVFNLLPDRSIKHNILLGKESLRRGLWLDLKEMNRRTKEVLTLLDASYLDPEMLVSDLKVGEQQIVEIAKALLNASKLLIMDEPTAALNQVEVQALFRNIKRLKQQGVTILYVSHRLEEIFELADRVTVLRDGKHSITAPIQEVNERSLVVHMIGREVSSLASIQTRPMTTEVLRVDNLTSGKWLQGISFSLHAGEILAVAGLAGSGKTELGKVLFGDLPLEDGAIYVRGKPFHPSPENAIRNGIIYLPEDRKKDGVIQGLSVKRNISLSVLPRLSKFLGILDLAGEKKVALQEARALDIKMPGIDSLASTLSGGNQQKVALARCLAADPEIFILMEPTQGIDVGVKFEIYQFIAEQSQQRRAILLISSELTEILGLAHRVLVMHEGQIAADLDVKKTGEDEILSYALGVTAAEKSASISAN